MQIVDNYKVLFCDVDDCLIKYPPEEGWTDEERKRCVAFPSFFGASPLRVMPIESTIQEIKKRKEENYFLVLWSQAGSEHITQVVTALDAIGYELSKYIDLIISKPLFIIDDLPILEIFQVKHPNELEGDKL